jgi:hypothetical protein
MPARASILYVTDPTEDPSDQLDLSFLSHSPNHYLQSTCTTEGHFCDALRTAPEPVNVVIVAGYEIVVAVLEAHSTLFREKVARLFVVGGHAKTLPIDPRLKERHPERFAESGDPRVQNPDALLRLLTCGEAVIWLPRDICLWRYVYDFSEPVLLSALPAFCLAYLPDVTPWLRLFRAVPAHISPTGVLTTQTETPNLYVVVAIDGQALSKVLTQTLHDG